MKFLACFLGKGISFFSKLFNLGAGETWPGELATILKPDILSVFLKKNEEKVILIAGTNGKTTTAKLISEIIRKKTSGSKIIRNKSGANLINGLISSIILNTNFWGELKADYFVFEVDELVLPLVLKKIKPEVVVLLNLFRDQLDRYGEVDLIAKRWQKALKNSRFDKRLILNADDPLIFKLGKGLKAKISYFGLEGKKNFLKKTPFWADSTYCPRCNSKLIFTGYFVSHQGVWRCKKCMLKRPKLSIKEKEWTSGLKGVYSKYNVLAAVLTGKALKVEDQKIRAAIKEFKPAFGRQEEVFYQGRKVVLYLSKNPTGFNESIRTIEKKGRNVVLMVLNDRIPDGRDVSWIWDVDLENLNGCFKKIVVSGDRAFDMGLRVKYANLKNYLIEERLERAIKKGLKETDKEGSFYILATYSAMLEVRKILLGREIY